MLVVRLPTSGLQISTSPLNKCCVKLGSHLHSVCGFGVFFLVSFVFWFWECLGVWFPVRQQRGDELHPLKQKCG